MKLDSELELDKASGLHDRILVVNPLNADWSYQLTTEIALRAKAQGAEVMWLNVAAKPDLNFVMNTQDYFSLTQVKNPLRRIELALTKAGVETCAKYLDIEQGKEVPNFSTVDDLRNYSYQNVNLGAMIFSAIATRLHTTSFDILDIQLYIERYFKEAIGALDAIKNEMYLFSPTKVLTINDRLISSSLCVNLAKKQGLQTRVYYWGSSPDRIAEYSESLYDSDEWRCKIIKAWAKLPRSRNSLETAELQLRQLGKSPSMDSKEFLSLQIQGRGFLKKNLTCVFYATSEHEHSPNLIGKSASKFVNQYEAFETLQNVTSQLGIDLIFKHHPIRKVVRDEGGPLKSSLDWEKVKFFKSTVVLPPDSDLDTYQIINDADVNVVWGSTVGLESIARGKRVMVLGDAHWINLSWGIHAWSSGDISDFLSNLPEPLDPKILLPWFYYLTNFGTPMIYSQFAQGGLIVNDHRIFINKLHFRFFQKLKNLWLNLHQRKIRLSH
jgi:hypothetical protein